MTYRNLYNEESTMSRIEGLFERNAARTGRTHLGSGSQASYRSPDKPYRIMTELQRANALQWGREGKLSATEIARELGSTPSSIRSLLKRHNIRPAVKYRTGSKR